MGLKKIFVVDDDEMLRTLVKDYLSGNPKYQVRTFPTGEDCLHHLGEKPDVVILDYYLNSIVQDARTGMQILQEIKKIDSSIKVIMLSSLDQYGKALQTISGGAMEYVVKDEQAFNRIGKILESIS